MRYTHKLMVGLLFVMAVHIGLVQAQTETYVRPTWDGVSRFTVLVLGIDRRPDEPDSLNYRPDAIMVFDAETRRFVDVNGAALRLYGHSRVEFLKLSHRYITAEEEDYENSIQETLNGVRHA